MPEVLFPASNWPLLNFLVTFQTIFTRYSAYIFGHLCLTWVLIICNNLPKCQGMKSDTDFHIFSPQPYISLHFKTADMVIMCYSCLFLSVTTNLADWYTCENWRENVKIKCWDIAAVLSGFKFSSVLWCCCSGDKKSVQPVKGTATTITIGLLLGTNLME